MHKLLLSALALICLSGAGVVANASEAETEHWLHVRVLDGEDKVAVNLPIELVAAALDAAENEHYRHGKLMVEDHEFNRDLVVAMLAAAAKSGDGEFVRIEEAEGGLVRVHKEKDMFYVDIDETDDESGEHEKVRVSLPIAVVRAMVDGESETLNVRAALEEMGKRGGALVTIDDGDSTVRVWVDASMEGI